jgi:septin family protein
MHWTFTKYLQPIFSLSELDVLAMKALQDRVNIVPVIAKADTLMAEEMKELKKKVRFCNVHFTISTCLAPRRLHRP